MPPEDVPDEEAHKHEGVLSLVIADGDKRIRRLPQLFLGETLIFADRDLAQVGQMASRVVEALAHGDTSATYRLHGCEFEGRRGLYGHDFYNRSLFRNKLKRAGFSFASDPYVIFTERGTFENRDWGEFSPDFVILANGEEDEVVETSGAFLSFILSDYRLGLPERPELRRLIDALSGITAVDSVDPALLVEALRKSLNE
ncbi:MAG: hypothetical protein ABR529_04965 [Actinomycetota bacterium]